VWSPDETVIDMGYILCPLCNEQLGKSIDAMEELRAESPEEYDGGGGA
jgi:hypothetical protein